MTNDPIPHLFANARKLKASDLHLCTNSQPSLRINGKLYLMDNEPKIRQVQMESIVNQFLPPVHKEIFQSLHQVDVSFHYPELGSLRANIYRKRGDIAIALRLIRSDAPTYKELGLPSIIEKFADLRRGLILISGPTGSGKSSTLTAILEDINTRHAKHILTVEDPIEFFFENKKSIFSQREIGVDVVDFNSATVGAMRQDQDVIMLSDLRDTETIENAMIAAETGHLVFGTTHAPTAYDSVTRIITSFPAEKQAMIQIKLAQNLYAVLAQRLLPANNGANLVLAHEHMIVSSRIRELILNPRELSKLSHVVHDDHVVKGVMAFDSHIAHLCRTGEISQETALEHATSRPDMKLRLSGIKK